MLDMPGPEALRAADRDAHQWRSGLLADVTRIVVEAALEAELAEHLGYPRRAPGAAGGTGNARNGTRRKTVHTAFGGVAIDVPRDRWGTFEPRTVGKWQRRVSGIDQLVVPLAAAGADPLECLTLLARVYGPGGGAALHGRIGTEIVRRMLPWHQRRLDPGNRALLLDRVVVRSKDGRIASAPVHAALGLRVDGVRELLGLRAGAATDPVGSWESMLVDLQSRGLTEVGAVLCDASSGVVDVVAQLWPESTVYVRAGTAGPRQDLRPSVPVPVSGVRSLLPPAS